MLVEGTPMVRLDDGARGVVANVEGELRVVYQDRGTERVAPKKETWFVAPEPNRRMRAEEMLEVALVAEKALRALERHEPFKHWEPIDPAAPAYDMGLRQVILRYLRDRG
jgi:hypothetical protein